MQLLNMIFSLNNYLELNLYFMVYFLGISHYRYSSAKCLNDFLKEKAFKTFSAVSADDIKEMWKYLELFGEPIGDNLKQADEKNRAVESRTRRYRVSKFTHDYVNTT